ncbi:MAG: hypothetical protein COZ49_00280 [Candidatus Yonathbacteria bacterium CG_4_10_14_3_um_filter_47_65]|uniref:AI-2E family transporter n=2 Tax=Parcubacteria group TaxID=1794811 RepID=A0A2M8D7K7_9BACT|nr:MAG: hypothetical protein AUJ44_01890 [Candidatus Nomurabacteria bacterium CG1_02_47_685]PIP04157.1 MAG: hypothetical protein COX54_00465 [Candidatus Yonathbacteria bacterium CG23_combo_of_CG06-09_8_20_14_all_46_18]PIQ31822.1 MAG: hypothetical protein COW61_02960 [Candidatus Yonathbacteria bacterium CG17_big_fil_post_rev_8_21_14_2_50_46_19]PIX56766.1 MAG: hypothetical protein COZ49_00280 [Candidatus Yonathbacteria bacterium CG_4_10_14_3_um_filter_47_65]PIY57600.1 MAG: hypothetical protein CO
MNDNSNNITITITSGAIIKTLLFLLFFYALYLIIDVILVVLVAVVIASAIEPATKWFARYRIPRIPAVIFVYAIIAFSLAGIFYFLVPSLAQEVSGVIGIMPDYVINGASDTVVAQAPLGGGQDIVNGLSKGLSIPATLEGLRSLMNRFSDISGGAFEAMSRIFGGVFSFFLIIVVSFYLAVQDRGIENFLKLIIPLRHRDYVVDLWKRSQLKIGLWMQGQLILGFIIGVLVYLGLTIIRVPYAFLFAVLAALFELIPVFGPILASIPAILLGFITGGVTLSLVVAGFYLIIQQFENHLIYPLVVRKVVGVPPILVVLALIIGAQLAGFLGILLSVPIAATLIEITNDITRKNRATGK